jgi:crotonobetainyl-CoA:carnitine CoA-transferase CaiB-like acyl-CoA transferase
MSQDNGLLSGLTVIEMGDTMSGTIAGQLLADYGAEVVFIEPPGGSPLRRQPAFPAWGRGKKSIELDLKNDADRTTAVGLISNADVVIESLRPNLASRLGVGPEAMTAINPRLVYASITAFPKGTKYERLQCYEALVMAKVGGFQSFAPTADREGPAYASVPYATFGAAQTALQGVFAALHERESSGQGQVVRTTLMQAVASIDPWNWMLTVLTSKFPEALSAGSMFDEDGVPISPFTFMLIIALTKDGRWLQFSQVQPHLYRALMRMLDLEWMYDDPEWATVPAFEESDKRRQLWEKMLEAVRSHTLEEWQEMFESDHDVWAELFRSGTELLHHPQMLHDERVVDIEDPDIGSTRQPGPMVKVLRGPEGRAETPAPRADADATELRARAATSEYPPAAAFTPKGLPLEGITVLELGTFYAGPFGSTVLTDYGARVIKAEEIDGDPMRTMLPFPEAGGARVLQGKESVAVDITSEEGREIVYEIAKKADLVLQTFRAGAAERLGYDADTMLKINPNLVYVNSPGYGKDGPCGDRPAYAPTIGAGSGVASRNAGTTVEERADLTMDEIKANSLRLMANNNVAFAQTDGLSALGVCTAMLLGLVGRDRGAGGVSMLTSMLSTVAHTLSEEMLEYEGKASIAAADDLKYGLGPTYRLYEASAGWVFLAAPTPKEWGLLTAALGDDALASDDRFTDAGGRGENAEALAEALSVIFATRPAAEWEDLMLAAGVGLVQATEEMPEVAFLGPLGHESGILAEINHPTFDDFFRLAPMVDFSRSDTVAQRGCLIGEHTDSVLAELGYSDERVADLRAKGVLGT